MKKSKKFNLLSKHDQELYLKRIKRYWDKGLIIPEIAEKMGCSETKIKNLLRKMGLYRSKLIKLRSNDAKENFYKDFLNGETIESIAEKYGYAKSTVRSVLSQLGVFKLEKNDKKMRKCNICGKKVLMGKYERFCKSCRKIASNYNTDEYRVAI